MVLLKGCLVGSLAVVQMGSPVGSPEASMETYRG